MPTHQACEVLAIQRMRSPILPAWDETEWSARQMMTIGKVAKIAGVNVETVRYYERRGLIERPLLREGSFRAYPKETVNRIRTIKRTQSLGFTLEEIKDLLTIRLEEKAQCKEVFGKVQRKISDIDEKIKSLRAIKRQLTTLASACQSEDLNAKCPILEALDDSI